MFRYPFRPDRLIIIIIFAFFILALPPIAEAGFNDSPDAYKAAEVDLESAYWQKVYRSREEKWPREEYKPLGYKKIDDVPFDPRFEIEDLDQGIHGFMETEIDYDIQKFENWFRESTKTVLNRVRLEYSKRTVIDDVDVEFLGSVDGRTNIYDVNYSLYRDNRFDLRELWAKWLLTDFSFKFGRQIFNWGVVKGDRPSDFLNPQDYYKWLVPPHEDRKIPVWGVSARMYLNPTNDLELAWLPFYENSRKASNNTDWLTENQRKVEYWRTQGKVNPVIQEITPDEEVKNGTVALRYRSITPEENDTDFYMSFITGWEYDPLLVKGDLIRVGSEDIPTRIRLLHERRKSLAFGWETAYFYDKEQGGSGKLGLRGESCITFDKPFARRYINSTGEDIVKKIYLESVTEIDHSFDEESLYMNLQMRFDAILDHDEFVDRVDSTIRVRYQFSHDLTSLMNSLNRYSAETMHWLKTGDLKKEVSTSMFKPGRLNLNGLFDYDFTLNDYFTRFWLWYQMSSSLHMETGINSFGGNSKVERYSQFDDNDEFFLSLKYGF
ncbi:MAG: hypothetical protein CVV64_04080 [Candidatus Wallbacteria bacterium HGW-Wallbacteria-1]|uniref:Uncharacterized protein n=1 Tax=Candidatus Wallbacteria bacterium HGW-Wallbacteria-1 TaxID=2013854 RepID=A0A2N1PRJ9_9BACT|nr:MAG: hypothetical protein CVV64_04080 [Candidatus Wallbacteria bacterium HGW-Wallbacteria-1]